MKSILYTCLTAVLFLTACSSDSENITISNIDDEVTPNSIPLHFIGDIQGFEEQETRVPLQEWSNNSRLYIQYHTANGLVDGIATYDAERGEWTTNYYGSITRGETAKCEVYYFDAWYSSNDTAITFEYNALCEYYSDPDATYIFENGVVTLNAHLRPMTGRLRFRGTPGYTFSVEGLKCYADYTIATNSFTSKNYTITLRVDEDGYTPYVYASFADEESRQLTVYCEDGTHLFHRNFDESVLAKGESGYIDVPTLESRNGWRMTEEDPVQICPNNSHPHKIEMSDGIKWACCNIGATNPSGSGYCYAWGETTYKYNFTWDNYKYYNNGWTKYAAEYKYNDFVDNKIQLELSDDAAYKNWGSTWRTPTWEEFKSLVSKCTWIWTTINGSKGCKVIAPNGNIIFLPAAGSYDCYYNPSTREGSGEFGLYWSSSLNFNGKYGDFPNWSGFCLYFGGNWIHYDYPNERMNGNSVRPVVR